MLRRRIANSSFRSDAGFEDPFEFAFRFGVPNVSGKIGESGASRFPADFVLERVSVPIFGIFTSVEAPVHRQSFFVAKVEPRSRLEKLEAGFFSVHPPYEMRSDFVFERSGHFSVRNLRVIRDIDPRNVAHRYGDARSFP